MAPPQQIPEHLQGKARQPLEGSQKLVCYDPCTWQVLYPAVSFRHMYLQQLAHEYPLLLGGSAPHVAFRNMAVHYNFGASLLPMPFKCRFLKVRFPQSASSRSECA